MPQTGEYADILRVIGAVLDEHGAVNAEIIEHQAFVAISWQQGVGNAAQRFYNDLDLQELRAQARELRGGGRGSGGRAELLRVLGQDLDAQKMELNGIVEDPDGYRVSGIAERRYLNLYYSLEEL